MPERDEDFRPTSGRLVGVLGLAVLAGLAAADLLRGPLGGVVSLPGWAWPLLVLLGTLVWAAVLRPRVWVAQGDLVLRTMVETVRVPLAAVESLAVRQVLVVAAGGRRYACPALGRPRRALVRGERVGAGGAAGGTAGGAGGGIGAFFGVRSWGSGEAPPGDEVAARAHERALGVDYARYVESRLLDLTQRARLDARVRPGSAEQADLAAGVRREPAWPEIALLAAGALGTLVLLAL